MFAKTSGEGSTAGVWLPWHFYDDARVTAAERVYRGSLDSVARPDAKIRLDIVRLVALV